MEAPDTDLIKEGDYVVFNEHGDKKSLVVIKRNGRAKVGKTLIRTGDLIGARWGSTYTMSAGGTGLVPVTEHQPVSGPAIEEVEKDNRDLVDLNTSQVLTADDIQAMKASGKGGGEIVEALCQHSTTFEAKTEFAQDKYKRRKTRKYLTHLTLTRPTGWSVCQVVFDKSPNSVWNLRPDSLALLLSLANVGAGSRCLVLENCQGLVSGAVAERLGGVGVACCLGTGGKVAPLSLLTQMNLGPHNKQAVVCTQLADLTAAAQRRATAQEGSSTVQQQQQQAQPEQQQQQVDASSQQQQWQPDAVANGVASSTPAQTPPAPAAAAAGGSCAAEAAGVPGGNGSGMMLSSRSIPVVAAAATAVAAPDVTETATEAAAAAAGEHAGDDLDALYDGGGAAAAANKRKRAGAKGSAEQQEQQQQQEHKRQKQDQQQQEQTEADTEMAEPETAAAAAANGGGGAGGKAASKEGRVQHASSPEALDQLVAAGFNSCVIAAPKLQPTAILAQVLPLLAPSSPFVVFCPWVQPLAEAMAALTADKSAIMLQLQESWLRPYQVLPGRTHPHMALTTGGTGGYILSGITVAASPHSGGRGEQQQQQQNNRGGKGRGGGRGGGGRRQGKGRGNTMRR